MKIGLEYEGVIIKEGVITRWSEIPRQSQLIVMDVMRDMGCAASHLEDVLPPCDRYDCLAEVRTRPLVCPQECAMAEDLAKALFREIMGCTAAFATEGYSIYWGENKIPSPVHLRISADLSLSKNKKVTYGIVDGKVWPVDVCNGTLSEDLDHIFRGGGMHINVSPVPRNLVPALALMLHQPMSCLMNSDHFKSAYRSQLLFRTREELGEPIAEYMSYGMSCHDKEGHFKFSSAWAVVAMQMIREFFDSFISVKQCCSTCAEGAPQAKAWGSSANFANFEGGPRQAGQG
jgi:hypothetical protein